MSYHNPDDNDYYPKTNPVPNDDLARLRIEVMAKEQCKDVLMFLENKTSIEIINLIEELETKGIKDPEDKLFQLEAMHLIYGMLINGNSHIKLTALGHLLITAFKQPFTEENIKDDLPDWKKTELSNNLEEDIPNDYPVIYFENCQPSTSKQDKEEPITNNKKLLNCVTCEFRFVDEEGNNECHNPEITHVIGQNLPLTDMDNIPGVVFYLFPNCPLNRVDLFDSKNSAIKILREENETLKTLNDSYKEQITSLREELTYIALLEETITKANAKIDSLDNSIKCLKDENHLLNQANTDFNKRIREVNKSLEMKDNLIKTLEIEKEHLTAWNAEILRENEQIKEEKLEEEEKEDYDYYANEVERLKMLLEDEREETKSLLKTIGILSKRIEID